MRPSTRNFLRIVRVQRGWMLMLIALLPIILSFILTRPAYAADITVDDTICTLAEAITSANNDNAAGNDCANGNGHDTLYLTQDTVLAVALPAINSDMTIEGDIATRFVSGHAQRRVFLVRSGTVNFQNFTIIGGRDVGGNGGNGYSGGGGGLGAGGGIYVENGTVTIRNVTFTGNIVKGGLGGGFGSVNMDGGGGGGSTNNPNAGGRGGYYASLGVGGNGGFGGGGGGGSLSEFDGSPFWGSGGDGGFGGGGGGSASVEGKAGYGGADGGNSDNYPGASGGGGAGLGGALFVRKGSLTLMNSTFVNNSAVGGSGGSSKSSGTGGAIFICTAAIDPSCGVTVVNPDEIYTNNTFNGNKADTYADVFPFFVNIDVQGNGILIPNGDSTPSSADQTNFGNVIVGTAVTRTFTILNNGNVDLTLSGSPRVDLSDNNAGVFSVLTNPDMIVNANGSTRFTIRFDPTFAKTVTATVSIASNHSDENPYNFVIQGSGMPVPTAVPTSSPTETHTPPTPKTTPTIVPTVTPTAIATATHTPIATPSPVFIVIVTSSQSVSFTQKLQDGIITVVIPTGAVSKTIELRYSTFVTLPIPPAHLDVTGYNFALDVYFDNVKQENFIFWQPITVTIEYSNASIIGIDENYLALYYYDAESKQWSDSGITVMDRDLWNNRIAAHIDHLSIFSLFAVEKPTLNRIYYLPIVIK